MLTLRTMSSSSSVVTKIKMTITTPYHPIRNRMVERFNKTLLHKQKLTWKEHVSTLTQAYNASIHDSIGYSLFYLVYGRYPRLAINAFLGLLNSASAIVIRTLLSSSKRGWLELIKRLENITRPRSAVGNVSGYRCVSDCRSRGRKFDPGPVPYFRGD